MSILCLTSACALAQNSSISNNRVYLILSHHPDSLINDSLKNECERFAEWKRTKGFRAYALSGNWTDQAVLDVINEYKTDEDSVKYILFVGNSYLGHQCAYNLTTYTFEDDSTTYSFLLGDNYTTYSDYYYECKGDTTKNPTIRCGRIPVNYAREAINVFDKIIAYEQNPTNNETFYKTYLSCAAFDAHGPYEIWHGYERGRCIHSSENICNLLANTIFRAKTKRVYLHTALSSGYTNNVYGYHNCDVFDDGAAFPSFLQNPAWWTGDTDAINDSINAGAFLMTYLGDGYSQTWQQREIAYQPDVVLYSVMDTIGLNNDNKYPVLMSMSRKSGKYDEATDCPAEFFLKKHHGGAVAVIAPTEEAYPGFKEYKKIFIHDEKDRTIDLNDEDLDPTKALRASFEKQMEDVKREIEEEAKKDKAMKNSKKYFQSKEFKDSDDVFGIKANREGKKDKKDKCHDKHKHHHKHKKMVLNIEFSPAEELLKYAELLEKGYLTKEEFERKKEELLKIDYSL